MAPADTRVTPVAPAVSRRVVGSVCFVLVSTAVAAGIATNPQLLEPAAQGIRDAGPFTDVAAPVARALRVLGAVATVGALTVALLAGATAQHSRATSLKVAASRWALLWAVAAGCSLVLELSQVSGLPISEVLRGEGANAASGIAAQVTGLALTAWLAALVSFFARRVESSAGLRVVLIVAAVALVVPVLTGHSGHAGFDPVALATLSLHVLAVSAWAGGLLALCAHADPQTRLDLGLLRRFSAMALVCYVVVATSGIANLWTRLSWAELVASGPYAVLLLLKVTGFIALGVFGLAHRRRTLRRVSAGEGASFWSLAAVEVAVMAAVLGLAVTLTATAPGETDDAVHAAPASAGIHFTMP
jgi:putative copper export protein